MRVQRANIEWSVMQQKGKTIHRYQISLLELKQLVFYLLSSFLILFSLAFFPECGGKIKTGMILS